MRGRGASPWTSPSMEGLGNTACSLECLACLNHVHGWTIWGGYGTLPLKPRFLVASDRSQVARRRVRLDLGDLGIIEQQLNQSSNQLGSQAFAQCDAFASDWSIPRTPGSVSSSHHPSPLPRATYDWAYQSALHSTRAMYGVTDSCLQETWQVLFLYVSKCRACFFSAPTRRYEIDLATHRASQGHAQS